MAKKEEQSELPMSNTPKDSEGEASPVAAAAEPEKASDSTGEKKPKAPIVPAQQEDLNDPARTLSAFAGEGAFAAGQRMAKAIAASSLMPVAYQNNVPNVLIAMELANRIGASVIMVAQNLDIIHGRPSWRAQFLIATVNACGRFSPLRFRWQGEEGTDAWGCRAVASDLKSREECLGSLITIALAKAEGWYSKSGSKWKTMPEQMLMYRSAAFWARVYAPELSLGISTTEEVIDVHGEALPDVPGQLTPGSTQALESALMNGA